MFRNAGIQFTVDPADVDEASLKKQALDRGLAPPAIALELAIAKAQSVSARHDAELVIGSDQILELEGRLLSKVHNMQQAAAQLQQLQGKTHYLHSAVVCCMNGNIEFQCVDTASLTMWSLSPNCIDAYLDETGSAILGSVGCYQIEGKGIRLFRDVSGNHFTIMGMPMIPLISHLHGMSTSLEGAQP
jgi:septum formation protein